MLKAISSLSAINRRTKVVFPAPDGAEKASALLVILDWTGSDTAS
jgi:hypothetical protein